MQTDDTETALEVLRELSQQVRRRRSMYIGDDYASLVALLVGMSEATRRLCGTDLMRLLQEHVKRKTSSEFVVLWPYFLLDELAGGDEEKATGLLFRTIDCFLEEALHHHISG